MKKDSPYIRRHFAHVTINGKRAYDGNGNLTKTGKANQRLVEALSRAAEGSLDSLEKDHNEAS